MDKLKIGSYIFGALSLLIAGSVIGSRLDAVEYRKGSYIKDKDNEPYLFVGKETFTEDEVLSNVDETFVKRRVGLWSVVKRPVRYSDSFDEVDKLRYSTSFNKLANRRRRFGA